MYKLIALDMDGTLLNSDKKVTDRVKSAIDEARKKGIKVVLISGRGYLGIENYIEELGIEDLVVTLNGAVVIDPKDKSIVFSEFLDGEIALDVIKENEERDLYTLLFTATDIHIEKLNDFSKIYEDNDGIKLTPVGRLSEFFHDHSVGKLIMIDDHERLKGIREELVNKYSDKANLTFSFPYFLEMFSPLIDKGVTLSKVAAYYGIKSSDVIAFGDAENDIEMLKYAGLGIVMGNASDSIKKYGDYVTASNDEDGVAVAIEKFILKK